MEALDHWRLCDELSIVDAALLVAGLDPVKVFVNDTDFDLNNPVYAATLKALQSAVLSKRLAASIRYDSRERGYDEEPSEGESIGRCAGRQIIFKHFPDWNLTAVRVDDLRHWLRERGIKTGFFFPNVRAETPDYLDARHPSYSRKLAAAIEAWMAIAVMPPEGRKRRTVKQAIEKWLRVNAGRFDLIKDDGSLNESGIEEVAKVANWDTKGGSPKM